MVELTNNGTPQYAVFTLAEFEATTPIIYVFNFTNTTTKESFEFEIAAVDDLSTNKKRYNEFELGTRLLNKQVGQWKYKIFDKDFNENILEVGSLTLTGAIVMRKIISTQITGKVYGQ